MAKNDSSVEVKPEKKFKGWFIPAFVVYKFLDGTISSKEMILLALIDSLTDDETNVPCFASNAYLGDQIQINNPRVVGRMISKLIKLKLVKKVKYEGPLGKGQRYLVATHK